MKRDIANPAIANFIYTKCSSTTANESMKLSVLFTQFPSVLAHIDSVLASPIPDLYYQFSNYNAILSALTLRGINYEPGITIPNLSMRANGVYEPVWSGGNEIDDDRPQTEVRLNGDYIFAWNIRNGEKIKISEKQATECFEPIMSICLFNINPIPYSGDKFSRTYQQATGQHKRSTHFVSSNEIKVNHRYDKTRYSEIYKTCCRKLHGLNYGDYVPGNKGSGIGSCQEIVTLHKNGIGIMQYNWAYSWDKLWDTDCENLYNVFERDWWERLWPLGETHAAYDNALLKVKGRMGHSDEWYLFDPNDPALQVQPYNMITYDYGDQQINHLPVWLMWDESSKCKIGQWICY